MGRKWGSLPICPGYLRFSADDALYPSVGALRRSPDEAVSEAVWAIDNNETGLQSFYLSDLREFAPSVPLLY